MATTITMNGSSYSFPVTGEENWGTAVNSWAVAASQALQRDGGTFSLTSDLNFGSTKGVLLAYLSSRSTAAAAGLIRLATGDDINWRNAGNDGDLSLNTTSDMLQFNGVNVVTSGTIVNADVDASAAIVYSKLDLTDSILNADINTAAAIARTKIANGTADHVVINDGSGTLSSEAQLGITRGGTGQSTSSAAMGALAPTTTKGDLIVYGTANVRLPVGASNGMLLQVNSSATNGLDWNQSIKGTSTNDSAGAGYVGEYKEDTTSTTSMYTTNQYGDLASLSLTAGDWDVDGVVEYILNSGSGITKCLVGFGTVTGNSGTGLVTGSNQCVTPNTPTSVANQTLTVPTTRISIAGTTTYYLKGLMSYTGGTPQFAARMSARRVR